MTYFETPTDAAAHYAGMTTADFEDFQDQIVADLENLDALGRPDLDPEDRPYVSESDVETVTAQDREDLETVIAWEQYHI